MNFPAASASASAVLREPRDVQARWVEQRLARARAEIDRVRTLSEACQIRSEAVLLETAARQMDLNRALVDQAKITLYWSERQVAITASKEGPTLDEWRDSGGSSGHYSSAYEAWMMSLRPNGMPGVLWRQIATFGETSDLDFMRVVEEAVERGRVSRAGLIALLRAYGDDVAADEENEPRPPRSRVALSGARRWATIFRLVNWAANQALTVDEWIDDVVEGSMGPETVQFREFLTRLEGLAARLDQGTAP